MENLLEDDSENLLRISSDEYWVGDFMRRKENHSIVRVPDEFLEDRFNTIGLDRYIDNLEEVYNSVLDKGPRGNFKEESSLYYLIHQRYIFTKSGLEAVLDKVMSREYGACPRVGCRSVGVIPIGLSDRPQVSSTKIYCHSCVNVYEASGTLQLLDGCAWGRSFPHFLILTHSYHFPSRTCEEYIPRIYGLRICSHDDNDSLSEDN
ncbi:CASEIN KINASE II BETA 2 SUBUNIT (BETA PRIME) [Encephalitozoon cuniculi GB-M1]|uniref:Casein kinase II subunit beta n=2 Tax=Encephalitozoon cuniculi TaxID=6035 RepID=Q8SR24_ENCCU|nr:casein kinase II subunit beta [Encephalitozoon cuniculi GB-M1]AGE96174.1 casein kinase II beta 2 subunit [Encephalitozoon cuniculi]KMV65272.1 casein kinase II subunit beta [Encephalitozoon cuniculi EcunIII-L]CAD25839.1 CASEIN KINASE II BETA 2 SUBUNIT (BETA PRIME) [Encephalitozoon cuniculi GB-M1]